MNGRISFFIPLRKGKRNVPFTPCDREKERDVNGWLAAEHKHEDRLSDRQSFGGRGGGVSFFYSDWEQTWSIGNEWRAIASQYCISMCDLRSRKPTTQTITYLFYSTFFFFFLLENKKNLMDDWTSKKRKKKK